MRAIPSSTSRMQVLYLIYSEVEEPNSSAKSEGAKQYFKTGEKGLETGAVAWEWRYKVWVSVVNIEFMERNQAKK